ncbi:hypothetical protein DENSPDRAFT_883454 [Dentipellis sp. KUC8613]|nr:hypothetical protein DENSPDRAFT_883454 [Dentipellis sp. KUC8613]
MSPTAREYTWLGTDHPTTLPLDLPTVALTLENSHHYALNSSTAAAAFHSLYPAGSLGFLRLGPHDRFFGLAMYHQLHCVDSLRRAILGLAPHGETRLGKMGKEGWQEDHVGHCLNYLRQSILCAADLTLEPEVVEGEMDAEEGLGVTHVCKDWSAVRGFAERNYEEWVGRTAKKAKGRR